MSPVTTRTSGGPPPMTGPDSRNRLLWRICGFAPAPEGGRVREVARFRACRRAGGRTIFCCSPRSATSGSVRLRARPKHEPPAERPSAVAHVSLKRRAQLGSRPPTAPALRGGAPLPERARRHPWLRRRSSTTSRVERLRLPSRGLMNVSSTHRSVGRAEKSFTLRGSLGLTSSSSTRPSGGYPSWIPSPSSSLSWWHSFLPTPSTPTSARRPTGSRPAEIPLRGGSSTRSRRRRAEKPPLKETRRRPKRASRLLRLSRNPEWAHSEAAVTRTRPSSTSARPSSIMNPPTAIRSRTSAPTGGPISGIRAIMASLSASGV